MTLQQEERQKRLGPGGLDPVEVFESLPPVSGDDGDVHDRDDHDGGMKMIVVVMMMFVMKIIVVSFFVKLIGA